VPVVDVWQFYESLTGTREGMSTDQRAVAAICDLRQEVNSGGFDSYFRYCGGDSASDALRALPDILGTEWAELLSAAADEREARIDELQLDERFDELDARFFDLEAATEADRLLSEHLSTDTP
jgi:hypothetical protein